MVKLKHSTHSDLNSLSKNVCRKVSEKEINVQNGHTTDAAILFRNCNISDL